MLRINKARMLLAESAFAGVADVALKCGFGDSFYFSTCFKKAVGCSPMQYRQSISRTGSTHGYRDSEKSS